MMTKNRIIFFSIFGGYHLITLLFTIYMDTQKDDFGLLARILSNFSLFKYGAFLGAILFVIDFIWTRNDKKQNIKDADLMRQENNILKAKVYDMQESLKAAATKIVPPVK
jgi:cell division protein FtsB